jgi:unsaturated chondroitin disaccharide hydrolase
MQKMMWILLLFFTLTLVHAQPLDDLVGQTVEYSARHLETFIGYQPDSTQHPKVTDEYGTWKMTARSGWTSGFFAGCLWLLSDLTGETKWQEPAERWTLDLAPEQYDSGDHDIGFRIMCSFGQGLRLANREEYKSVLFNAAGSLAKRYDPGIGCIRSWSWGNWNFPVIIDNMMNLELLMWSAANGGPSEHRDMAISHAKKTVQSHVREDGSTFHVVDFDDSGNIVSQETRQGYADSSTWSRGQAWGLYGYTMMVRYTGDQQFLDTAIMMADYFISHLPADSVPFYDFDDPAIPRVPKDASAAAIACAALYELSEYAGRQKYLAAARNILRSLMTSYLSEGTLYESILRRACQWKGDIERGAIYADYYFLEALQRERAIAATQIARASKSPHAFKLGQNYPNPFNTRTTISFNLDKSMHIKVSVCSVLGQESDVLLDREMAAGSYHVTWSAAGYPTGSYLIRVETPQRVYVIKSLFIK